MPDDHPSDPFDAPHPSETPDAPPPRYGEVVDPYDPNQPQGGGSDGKAIAALVLGIIGLIAWCCPIVGLPIGIVGYYMGRAGKGSRNHNLAVAGSIMSIITIVLSLINAVAGIIMNLNGTL